MNLDVLINIQGTAIHTLNKTIPEKFKYYYWKLCRLIWKVHFYDLSTGCTSLNTVVWHCLQFHPLNVWVMMFYHNYVGSMKVNLDVSLDNKIKTMHHTPFLIRINRIMTLVIWSYTIASDIGCSNPLSIHQINSLEITLQREASAWHSSTFLCSCWSAAYAWGPLCICP